MLNKQTGCIMKNSILIILLWIGVTSAAIINVPADQATIQAGIHAAASGDTVLVAEGSYKENISFKGKGITLASFFIIDQDTSHISKTIIDGSGATNPDSASTVLFVSGEDTTCVLCGFTITGGQGTLLSDGNVKWIGGGGIFCYKSGARIVHNIVRHNNLVNPNAHGVGGGIIVEQGGANVFAIIEDNVIKENSIISNRLRAEGGGIGVYASCLIRRNVITNNTVSGLTFTGGAGLEAGQNASMRIFDNTITNNISKAQQDKAAHGAVSIFAGKVEFVGNTISDNSVESQTMVVAPGIFLSRMQPGTVIHDNVFARNTSNRQSFTSKALIMTQSNDMLVQGNTITDNVNTGGIHMEKSSVLIRGNTITDNQAYYATGISGVVSKTVIENNIVARNTGDTGSGGGWLMSMESALVQNNLFYENDAGSRAAGGLAIGKLAGQSMQMDKFEFPARFASSEIQKLQKSNSTTIPDLGAVVLLNNTIVNNRANTYGGGLLIGDWQVFAANNIIWGNTTGLEGAQISDPDSNLTIQNSIVQGGWSGIDVHDVDPLFAGESFALSRYSPCIGAGISALTINGVELSCPETDCMNSERPNPAGSNPDIGAIESELAMPEPETGVHSMLTETPRDCALQQNYPNPFNPTTTIEYRLPHQGHVMLAIYNLAGQHIRTLVDEQQSAGAHSRMWNGMDEHGNTVSSGVYLYRIYVQNKAAGRKAWQSERKMVVLR